MGDSRHRVAGALFAAGSATVPTIAGQLGITQQAVRRHLDVLVAEGLAEAQDPTRRLGRGPGRGRGRPARAFALTEQGRAGFPAAYDDLALVALQRLLGQGGQQAVVDVARDRVASLDERYGQALAAAPAADRPAMLADALNGDGYAATLDRAPDGLGVQVCQHHCPVSHVAQQFPELCEAETEVFARLLGTHVQRLATIAHGDGVCTTYVPATSEPVPSERTTA
jgi:predicted ArsR family transcriptional regulator